MVKKSCFGDTLFFVFFFFFFFFKKESEIGHWKSPPEPQTFLEMFHRYWEPGSQM